MCLGTFFKSVMEQSRKQNGVGGTVVLGNILIPDRLVFQVSISVDTDIRMYICYDDLNSIFFTIFKLTTL